MSVERWYLIPLGAGRVHIGTMALFGPDALCGQAVFNVERSSQLPPKARLCKRCESEAKRRAESEDRP